MTRKTVRTERPGPLIRTALAPTDPVKLDPTTTGSWANEPLLQGDENHRPWHTTFKPPSHYQIRCHTRVYIVAVIFRFLALPPSLPPSALPLSASSNPQKASPHPHTPRDDKTHRLEREARKRTEYAGPRIDAGLQDGRHPHDERQRVNPGLVEDQIESSTTTLEHHILERHSLSMSAKPRCGVI